MATKHKRSNYLIDKPFQLGFISRYVVIIILTIISAFIITLFYYWFISNVGEFKLNTSIVIQQQGHRTYNGKKIYNYEKDQIKVYEDLDENGNKVYKCYQVFNDSITFYKIGDVIENIDENALTKDIGRVERVTNRFKLLLFPLSLTAIILIVTVSIYSLFFSHRMAGPIYRLRISLDRMLAGDFDFRIRVRKKDFFINIVDRLEQLRLNIKDKKK